eukprot:gnl/Spiro4/17480_TR9299_c0_g1_i1.p1 gnl/Spiro4/17480_TR9299_c0_g1~~gnl/Spiro4/17480_TR9299_c0_g1_i1.p1  ORF type:complete len:563 (-),score=98.28 gnl/Spiro4/17480_TR9299_c0_g1_i1:99-1733(-)
MVSQSFASKVFLVLTVCFLVASNYFLSPFWYKVVSILLVLLVAYGYWPALTLPDIPGPPFTPFFGSYPEILRVGAPTLFDQYRRLYGPIFKVYEGRRCVVVCCNAQLAQEVGLSKTKQMPDRPVPAFRRFARKSYSLLWTTGKLWKRARAALVPVFSTNMLKSFAPYIHTAVDRFLDNIAYSPKSAVAGFEPDGSINAFDWWSRLTMEVIGVSAFGKNFRTQQRLGLDGMIAREQQSVLKNASVLFRGTSPNNSFFRQVIASSFPFLSPLILVLSYPILSQLREALTSTDNLALEIVKDRREHPEKFPDTRDFITLLLNCRVEGDGSIGPSGEPTDEFIRDHVVTFLLAGYETTANLLTYLTFLLATNPEQDAKLYSEISRLCPTDQHLKDLQLESLEQFTYTEAVVNEALRLYPPAVFSRVTEAETELGGYAIPVGTPVIVSTRAVHLNEEHWEAPLEFRPERFLPDNPENKRRHKYAHIPFGVGPHMCIGFRFALEEAKMAVIRVFSKYRFSLSPATTLPLHLNNGITMSTREPIYVLPTAR